MNKAFLFLVVSALALAISACNNAQNEHIQLQEKVIALHDSIMPKMGLFVRDNIKIDLLLTKMDSLKAAHPSLDTTLEKEKLTALKTKLQHTHDAMTDWMHQFTPVEEQQNPEEAKSYLKEQLQVVQDLKKQFTDVEKESNEVLKTYQ